MSMQVEPRPSHPYYMYDNILGQPSAIARVLNGERDSVRALAQSVNSAERVHVVGIGTSWHASLVGEHLLRTIGGRQDARAWNSYEFCAYPPSLGAGDLVIVMSHRGTKMYSAQALEMAKAGGAHTALVTGIGSGGKLELAEVVLRTSPQDRSAAFTISHTTAMTALAMLATEVGVEAGRAEARELQRSLTRLPRLVEAALAPEPEVRQWARQSVDVKRSYFIGWGPNASTAYEVALKLKEAAYVTTEGFQLEQYLHGPFVATEPGCMVAFIAPPGPGRGRATTIIEAANAVGAHTVAIFQEGDEELSRLVKTAIAMPAAPEALTPIVYLAPLQLFTYWLAVELEHNPDVFRLDDPIYKAARQKYQL